MTLFKTGRYFYKTEAFSRSSFSEGTWVMKKHELILTSDIKKNDLPVKLDYLNDASEKNNRCKIAIVKNLKGELLTNGLVYINNDTLRCFPLMDTCFGTYNNIDSLKVAFEYGFTSKWIKVEHKEYKQLQLVLQLDFKVSSYEAFDNEKCKVLKSSIRFLD